MPLHLESDELSLFAEKKVDMRGIQGIALSRVYIKIKISLALEISERSTNEAFGVRAWALALLFYMPRFALTATLVCQSPLLC